MEVVERILLEFFNKRVGDTNSFVSSSGVFFKGMFPALMLAVIISSCSSINDDDRDICCASVQLHYRYVRQDFDEYKKFIKNMRHFIFDHEEKFLYEAPSNPAAPQRLVLRNLPEGTYTVVTLGNVDDTNDSFLSMSNNLQTICLSPTNRHPNGDYANSEEFFWNTFSFTTLKNKTLRHSLDLSNIHCHLFVRIFWNNKPPHRGVYTMRLEGVPIENFLDSRKKHNQIVISDKDSVLHMFPGLTGKKGNYSVQVPLYNFELQAELITLRYTNQSIPTFSLYFEDQAVSKPIDLSKAFKAWGWRPDEHSEQIYRIQMELFDDGKVVVEQWADASILDWFDGGTIGTGI